ncbi:MAG: hypothetical protein ACD_87C00028G0003 [uncultured bacterium]|nr:MAG: hypothetical protein ACD_87C00028G0003 [uncultured bacterium]
MLSRSGIAYRPFFLLEDTDQQPDLPGRVLPSPPRIFTVETEAALFHNNENDLFHLQRLGNRTDEHFFDLRKTQKGTQPAADLPQQLPVVVAPSEKQVVDGILHPFPKRIEKQDDDDRQDQGKQKRIAAAGLEKEGMEQKDNEDVKCGENARQDDIARSSADEDADVQKIIFQDAESEKNCGDKAEISQRVDGDAADRKDGTGKKEGGKTQSSEDVLDPVSRRIVGGPLHGAIKEHQAVDDGRDGRRGKKVKERPGAGDPAEIIVMEPADVKIRGDNGQKSDREEQRGDLQPPSAVDAQKDMHEPNVDRDTENEEEMNRPVDQEGEFLVGEYGNKGHFGVEKRAEEADAGK